MNDIYSLSDAQIQKNHNAFFQRFETTPANDQFLLSYQDQQVSTLSNRH